MQGAKAAVSVGDASPKRGHALGSGRRQRGCQIANSCTFGRDALRVLAQRDADTGVLSSQSAVQPMLLTAPCTEFTGPRRLQIGVNPPSNCSRRMRRCGTVRG